MNLDACLPAELRGPTTTISKISAGLSGAGVYRVDANGQSYVLKMSNHDEPLGQWRSIVAIQQLAANAGVAPSIVHTDESCRAIVSAFVADRSFPALFMTPTTREAALALLATTIRRVHDLPLPAEATSRDATAFLGSIWERLDGQYAIPAFVGDAVRRVLSEEVPPSGREVVLSHNDVNPSNLVYDGEHLFFLDWDAAGPNDPFYDLATIAVFLRMDDDTCKRLLSAYDGALVEQLPPRFMYCRRMVAVLCGTTILDVTRRGGYAPASEAPTLESVPALGEFYQLMRTGKVNIATTDGQWWFGLALTKESLGL
ncbi:MAG: phosphotransferase [bacterium]